MSTGVFPEADGGHAAGISIVLILIMWIDAVGATIAGYVERRRERGQQCGCMKD